MALLKAGDNKEIIFELEAIEEAVPNKPFFTVEEAARVMRKSVWSVYRMIKMGCIEATKPLGEWRIPRGTLVRYLQERNNYNLD